MSVAWPQPARALSVVTPTTVAYTDSQHPRTTLLNPATDLPVGTRVDANNQSHTSRAYVSFDITQFRGAVIRDAVVYVVEHTVTDCSVAAPIELWRTGPITAQTSWQKPPAELEKVGQVSGGAPDYCPGHFYFSVVPVLTAALARRDKVLTLEVRVAAAREADVSLGRTYASRPGLTVNANHPPTISAPAVVTSTSQPCGTLRRHTMARGYATFSAKVSDVDPQDYVSGQFAIWPVDHPEQRQQFGGGTYSDGTARAETDLSAYPHGTVLAWSARAFDQLDYSAWTSPCYLEIDTQAPVKAPVVASAQYPEGLRTPGSGGPGIAGTFRFDAQGDRDVVAYFYTDNVGVYQTVAARYPGGPAKVSVTPSGPGPHSLWVTSLDAAGNRGPTAEYQYWVRDTALWFTVDAAGVNLPSHIRLTSSAAEVTSFGYQVTGGTEIRVPAVNGVGVGQLTFTANGYVTVTARSYAGNTMIGIAEQQVIVDDAPGVASAEFNLEHDVVAGQTGTFTFRPRTDGVVAYLYSFDYAAPPQRIDAGADGTAVLTWTPTVGQWYDLNVQSVQADGSTSATTSYQFYVIDPRPTVYSGDLGGWPRRVGVGVPLEIDVNTQMSGVAEFVYQFNDGPQQTVASGGFSARIIVAPEHAGDNAIVVRSRFSDGTLSPATTWTFQITNAPVVSSVEYPQGGTGGQTGQPGNFTFRPGLPGVASYRYSFDGADEQSVAAGPDGSATVAFTPSRSGYLTVNVYSLDAAGTPSETRMSNFIVRDPTVYVYGSYIGWMARGGIGVPGQMGFYSGLFGDVTEYVYRINDGAAQTVPASTDSTTTYLTITPDRNGSNTLYVRSRTATGQVSPETAYAFQVGTAPYVVSAQYPANVWSGGVGVPGTFAFSGGTAGVVEFEYQVSDGSSGTVPAGASGAASVTVTPTAWGSASVTVRGRLGDGTRTDSSTYYFCVQP